MILPVLLQTRLFPLFYDPRPLSLCHHLVLLRDYSKHIVVEGIEGLVFGNIVCMEFWSVAYTLVWFAGAEYTVLQLKKVWLHF